MNNTYDSTPEPEEALDSAKTALNYILDGPLHRGEQYLNQAIHTLAEIKHDVSERINASRLSKKPITEDELYEELSESDAYFQASQLVRACQLILELNQPKWQIP